MASCNIRLNKQQSQHPGNSFRFPVRSTEESIKQEPEASTSNDQPAIKTSISQPSTIPSIVICPEGLEVLAHMMIDTGAGLNLIKQNAVNPELPIYDKIVLKLTGINDLPLFRMRQL